MSFLNWGSCSEIKKLQKCFCTQRFGSVLLPNAFVHNVSALFCCKMLLYITFSVLVCSKMLLYTTFLLSWCSRRERHAAWERSATMQNERHAAWERIFAHL